jgi:hypothetical protein
VDNYIVPFLFNVTKIVLNVLGLVCKEAQKEMGKTIDTSYT